MTYPTSYHVAMAAVIRTPVTAPPARMAVVRRQIARAICDMRRQFGPDRARRELGRFYFVGAPLREWARVHPWNIGEANR